MEPAMTNLDSWKPSPHHRLEDVPVTAKSTSTEQLQSPSPGSWFRLTWDQVPIDKLHLYSNADPREYTDTSQTTANSGIPDEHWMTVFHETADPWDQVNTLWKWANQDKNFVRNVRLEVLVNMPVWQTVDPTPAKDGHRDGGP